MSWSHRGELDGTTVTCLPLVPERFEDMETVLGERGVARRCFCMHWRRPYGGHGDSRSNRDRFADRVAEDPPPGLIGYLGDEPVAWVQVGPRGEFPTLERSTLLHAVDDAEPWSINCFVTRVGYRRQGIAGVMLEAAVAYAQEQGAVLLEGYPVDGFRASTVDYFTGTLGMFQDEGFVEILRRNETRPIVRKYLVSGTGY